MSSAISTSLAGSGTGLDVQATVDQIIYAERAPERLMQNQQSALQSQASELRGVQSKLGSLQNAINDLKDATGPLRSVSATSSNPAQLTASAQSTAISGTHMIVVQNLATAHSFYSNAVTDPSFTFSADTTLQIQIGSSAATTLTLDGKTLEQAADYINTQNAGVRASVITDATGARLAISSLTTGLPGQVQVLLDTSGLHWQDSAPAANAKLTIDGIPVESTTNTVAGAIAGVTLNLMSQSASPVTLTVGPDTDKARQAVNSFVSAYNSLMTNINAEFTYNGTTHSAGVLAGDGTLRQLQGTLLSDISYSTTNNNGFESLRAIGVNMQDDGTLSIDSTKLDDALTNHYTDFVKFFQSSSPDGFAIHMGTDVLAANDSIDGPITIDINGIEASNNDLDDQIANFEARIAGREKVLLDQYSRIDVMLREFPTLLSQVNAQLGSLNSK